MMFYFVHIATVCTFRLDPDISFSEVFRTHSNDLNAEEIGFDLAFDLFHQVTNETGTKYEEASAAGIDDSYFEILIT